VIEDDPASLELARDLLQVAGFNVLKATTADEGLALARAELPDLILMDMGLQNTSGLEATRALKKDAATKHIPVVAITSHAMSAELEQAMEAGCDGYIVKPIDTRSFAGTVAGFLRP